MLRNYSRSCDVSCFQEPTGQETSVEFGFPSQAAVNGAWVSRMLWTGWYSKRYSRSWSRCSNQRFMTAATAFVPTGVRLPPLLRQRGTWKTDTSGTVDIDLSRFFDRVHHQRLLNRMAQQVEDGRILKLVHRLLKARVVLPDGTRTATNEGTPQGGPLSPLLSNIVLDELDWELERRGLRFVRYADDFSVFVQSERAGRRVMNSIRKFIERRLRLMVNEDKSSVSGPIDLTFLGFHLSKSEDGSVAVAISERTKERMDARIHELTPRTWGRSLNACFGDLNRYLRGWIGYFRLCTEDQLRPLHKSDAHIRRRLRAIIIRQKKRPQHLYRHLIACDVPPRSAAHTAYQRTGVWRRSVSSGIHKAYPNAWFATQLIMLTNQWHAPNPTERVSVKQQRLFDT